MRVPTRTGRVKPRQGGGSTIASPTGRIRELATLRSRQLLGYVCRGCRPFEARDRGIEGGQVVGGKDRNAGSTLHPFAQLLEPLRIASPHGFLGGFRRHPMRRLELHSIENLPRASGARCRQLALQPTLALARRSGEQDDRRHAS